jgi:RNA polymerase sigma-70 factor (ECF subfamily)
MEDVGMANAEQEKSNGGTHEKHSDRALLRRLRNGSQDAATELYIRYAERLRLLTRAEFSAELARRVDVEDIVQSVFVSFFRGVNQGYYDVPAGDELWKLFLVIALNKIRAKGAFHRASKRDVRLTVGAQMIDHGGRPQQDTAPLALLRMVVDEILDQLPAQQKQMVVHRIEGFEVAEIAAKTGRSKRTIERVLQEFRQRLATVLQGD